MGYSTNDGDRRPCILGRKDHSSLRQSSSLVQLVMYAQFVLYWVQLVSFYSCYLIMPLQQVLGRVVANFYSFNMDILNDDIGCTKVRQLLVTVRLKTCLIDLMLHFPWNTKSRSIGIFLGPQSVSVSVSMDLFR